MKWFTDENMVYTLKDTVWLGIPSKENDYFFGVNNPDVSKAMRNSIAEDIAHKLNSYDQLCEELEQAKTKIEAAKHGLLAVSDLINNSDGIAGLHLNGDVAKWSDLIEGGRFEEWLIEFDCALEDLS